MDSLSSSADTPTSVLSVHTYGNAQSAYAPVVCLHGWGSNSRIWEGLIQQTENVFSFMCIDLPGFGSSENVHMESLDELIETIAEMLPKQCHLLGWSLGGMLAVGLASRCVGSVLSVTTVGSNLKFVQAPDWECASDENVFMDFQQELKEDPQALAGRFTQLQGRGDKQRKHVVSLLREIQEVPDRAGDNASYSPHKSWQLGLAFLDQLDLRNVLSHLEIPVSAIFSKNDTLVPVAAAKRIQAIAGAEFRDYFIEGAGHVPHVSQPEKVAAILEKTVVRAQKPYHREKAAISRAFSDAAASYDQIAQLQRRVAARTIELQRLENMRVCDIGCGTGFCIEALLDNGCEVLGLDIAPGMLRVAEQKFGNRASYLCADFDRAPFAEHQPFDAYVSSMSLQWSENLAYTLSHLSQFLIRGGTVQFATLAQNTLHELRDAWSAVDSYVHINQFESVSTILDQVKAAGLEVLSHRVETETLEYGSALALMKELKGIGAHNINAGKPRNMTTRAQLRRLEQAYESYRNAKNTLPATYEIVYIVAKN